MIWDRQYYNISTNFPLIKDKNRSSHSSLFSVGVEIHKKAAVPCGALLSEVGLETSKKKKNGPPGPSKKNLRRDFGSKKNVFLKKKAPALPRSPQPEHLR